MSAGPPFWFDRRLSWDGILTFGGGLLALIGILWQVWRSDRRLERQWRHEEETRGEEQERQSHALARALLCEISMFEEMCIDPERAAVGSQPRQAIDPLQTHIAAPGPDPFPVYMANAHRIGEFDDREAEAIVRFYILSDAFLSLRKDAAALQTQLLVAQSSPPVRDALVRTLHAIEGLLPGVSEASGAAKFTLQELLRQGTASAVPKPRVEGGGGNTR